MPNLNLPGIVLAGGFLNLGDPSEAELTIAEDGNGDGVITVTQSYHVVDTESDASTDNLDIINGGNPGDILVLQTINFARDVTLRDLNSGPTSGNIQLSNATRTLSARSSKIILIRGIDGNWEELSYSAN